MLHGDKIGTCDTTCEECEEFDEATCQCVFASCPPSESPSYSPSASNYPSEVPTFEGKGGKLFTSRPTNKPIDMSMSMDMSMRRELEVEFGRGIEHHRKTKVAKSKAYKEVRKMFNVSFLAAIHLYDLTYYLNAFFTRFATLPATRTVRGRTNKLQ